MNKTQLLFLYINILLFTNACNRNRCGDDYIPITSSEIAIKFIDSTHQSVYSNAQSGYFKDSVKVYDLNGKNYPNHFFSYESRNPKLDILSIFVFDGNSNDTEAYSKNYCKQIMIQHNKTNIDTLTVCFSATKKGCPHLTQFECYYKSQLLASNKDNNGLGFEFMKTK